jgi:hypothetical protein
LQETGLVLTNNGGKERQALAAKESRVALASIDASEQIGDEADLQYGTTRPRVSGGERVDLGLHGGMLSANEKAQRPGDPPQHPLVILSGEGDGGLRRPATHREGITIVPGPLQHHVRGFQKVDESSMILRKPGNVKRATRRCPLDVEARLQIR